MQQISKFNCFYIINNYIFFDKSEKSFDSVDLWLKDLKANSNPDIKVFLIGNKSDLEETRQVSKDTAMRYKEDFEFDLFLETSAKTGYNTQELFVEAAKLLYKEYIVLNKSLKNNQKLKLKTEVVGQKSEKKCCK